MIFEISPVDSGASAFFVSCMFGMACGTRNVCGASSREKFPSFSGDKRHFLDTLSWTFLASASNRRVRRRDFLLAGEIRFNSAELSHDDE